MTVLQLDKYAEKIPCTTCLKTNRLELTEHVTIKYKKNAVPTSLFLKANTCQHPEPNTERN